MRKTRADPIIEEVRAIRDEYAAGFDYDVAAIFRDLRARQKACGREFVRFPPRGAAGGSDVDGSAVPGDTGGTGTG